MEKINKNIEEFVTVELWQVLEKLEHKQHYKVNVSRTPGSEYTIINLRDCGKIYEQLTENQAKTRTQCIIEQIEILIHKLKEGD
jgi:hypothetical protein